MTLTSIVFDLWETIRSAKITDDDNLDIRLISRWVDTQRALWLKRQFDKGEYIDDNLCQTLTIPMEIIDPSADTTMLIGIGNNIIDTPYFSTDRVLRSQIKQPIILETYGHKVVSSVTGANFTKIPFKFCHFNELPYMGESKFTSKSLFIAIRDNYWYCKYGKNNFTPNVLKTLVSRVVLQEPTTLIGFDYNTSIYPMNNSLMAFLKDSIIKSDLRTILVTASDDVNDSSGKIDNGKVANQ